MSNVNQRERALALVRLECEVIPTHKKRPCIDGWKERASSDLADLASWWTRWPDAEPAVHLGRSRLVVVDLDTDEHGKLPDVADLDLPATWSEDTPRGGRHYYYRVPDGFEGKKRLGWRPKVDLLTGPNFAVVWQDPPEGVEAAPAPPWLLAALAGVEPEARAVQEAEPGMGHVIALRAGARAGRVAARPEDANAALLAAAGARGGDDHTDAITAAVLFGSGEKLRKNMATYVRLVTSWAARTKSDLWWDDFSGRAKIGTRDVGDADFTAVRLWVAEKYGFDAPKDGVVDAVVLVAQRNRRHPIREQLSAITWDGLPRLLRVAREILGVDDPLSAELVARWMVGAIARIYQPGAKLDTVLVLVGPQGLGKSTFFDVLAGGYFSDTAIPWGRTQDVPWHLGRAWIHELAELACLTKHSIEAMKAAISARSDLGRAPYQRTNEVVPRQCAFGGSTNNTAYLVDGTGNRRFWTVHVEKVDRVKLRAWRDQLWAEARALFEAGEPWHLEETSERALADRNDTYRHVDVLAGRAKAWAEQATTPHTLEAICTALGLDHPSPPDQSKVVQGLTEAGWTLRRLAAGSTRVRVYIPPPDFTSTSVHPVSVSCEEKIECVEDCHGWCPGCAEPEA